MNSDDVIIRVKDLRIGYGDRVVLENINFEVRRGEVFVIIGRSGSGKSTLLKNIIGLYQPMAGDISISDRSLISATGEERRQLRSLPKRCVVRLYDRARKCSPAIG
jgi:phospholipid/cholesterol/gamma-HCH transport system ATP-binding protein